MPSLEQNVSALLKAVSTLQEQYEGFLERDMSALLEVVSNLQAEAEDVRTCLSKAEEAITTINLKHDLVQFADAVQAVVPNDIHPLRKHALVLKELSTANEEVQYQAVLSFTEDYNHDNRMWDSELNATGKTVNEALRNLEKLHCSSAAVKSESDNAEAFLKTYIPGKGLERLVHMGFPVRPQDYSEKPSSSAKTGKGKEK